MKQKFIYLFLFVNSVLLYSQGINTVDRNDAGASGSGVLSGFYQTASPANFPGGATSWWHLLDVRHTNPSNNYAMQFSGSFFDQNLWFRKTNDEASRPWSRILMEDSAGKVGIGGAVGEEKLTMTGGHTNTTFLMHADNGGNPHAYLSLWASEPGMTYSGAGLGNNIRSYVNGQTFARINTSMGGSYMRLLENEINFNLISSTGGNKRGLTISADGTKVNGQIVAENGVLVTSRPTNEGGALSLINSLKTGSQIQTWTIYNMTGGYGNSLQFWNYSADGTKLTPRLKISDEGDMALYGKFEAKEVKVTNSPTADFVFDEDYALPKLEAVERHIKEKRHLPEIASAAEMEKEGVNVGEFQIKLLQKIEELTLYSIQQNKKIERQDRELGTLRIELEKLKQNIKTHE